MLSIYYFITIIIVEYAIFISIDAIHLSYARNIISHQLFYAAYHLYKMSAYHYKYTNCLPV